MITAAPQARAFVLSIRVTQNCATVDFKVKTKMCLPGIKAQVGRLA